MRRTLMLVVGAGRSGTSSFSGMMNLLGFHVPPPVVGADETNPLGHFEPQWAVDFHKRILAEAGYRTVDGDPLAGRHCLEVARSGGYRSELRVWLESVPEFEQWLLVKDPRTVWIAPLWAEVAEGLGMRVAFVTLLRPASEVIGSHARHYARWENPGQKQRGQTAVLAGWINVNLRAEEVSRGAQRHSILYQDLLADWRAALEPLNSSCGLSLDLSDDGNAARAVDDFVDPDLRRLRDTWEGSLVPAELREIADDLWADLVTQARGELDEATYVERMSTHRASFTKLFDSAAMISRDRRLRAVAIAQRTSYQEALNDATRALDDLR